MTDPIKLYDSSVVPGPRTIEDYVASIIMHRDEKKRHAGKETVLKAELRKLMEEQGLDTVKSFNGTASIGKDTVNYSVPWTKITPTRKKELLQWCTINGMESSVNSKSFSSWLAAEVESGSIKQESLPEEVTLFTTQRLNIRSTS